MPKIFEMIRTVSAGALLLAVATPALAQDVDFPSRKPGQWEIKIVPEAGSPMPATTIQTCIDAASDKAMMQAGLSMSKKMCSQQDMKLDGDTFTIDSACTIGPMKTTSHVVMSGDFQSAYTVKVTGTATGGMAAAPHNTNLTQEARWVGAECTGGMKGGDMLMPGGMKMNVTDMMKAMGG
jgi:hypothetical protein